MFHLFQLGNTSSKIVDFPIAMLVYRRVVGSCHCFFDWGVSSKQKIPIPQLVRKQCWLGVAEKKSLGRLKIPGKQKSFQLDFGDPFWAMKTRRLSDFFKTESHGKPPTCQETGLRTARVSQSFPGRDRRLSVKQRNYCESQHLSLLLPRHTSHHSRMKNPPFLWINENYTPVN